MLPNSAEYEDLKRGSSAFPFQYAHLTPSSTRYVMPFHWHMDYELLRICDGSLPISIDNHHFLMHTNDVLIIPPGAIHGSQMPTGSYECVVFEITTLFSPASLNLNALQNIWEKNGNQPIYLPANGEESLLAHAFFETVRSNNEDESILRTCGYLLALFGSIAKVSSKNSTSKKPSNQHQLDRIKKVIIYMKKNYQNPITLSELADIAGLNREYLCRIFRQIIGKSPIQFLIEYRIERSKKYLLSPTGNVTDAALSSGFSDLSYYIRKFTELNGVTPMQYRKREIS